MSPDVTACRTISDPGIYTLQNDVSSTATCITISSSDVIFRGNGSAISYGSAGTGIGIKTDTGFTNITVEGNNITKSGASGNRNYAIHIQANN